MATQVVDVREQKVQEFMAKGHDRYAAENLADCLPEWSQRIDTSLRDLPNTAKAIAAAKKPTVSLGKPTLGDLEGQLLSIQENIHQRTEQQGAAEDAIAQLEDRQMAATEILKELEGQQGIQVRADRSLAEETLAKVTPKLQLQRDRLAIILKVLTMWRQRLKEFPRAELKKLRQDAARRDRMSF